METIYLIPVIIISLGCAFFLLKRMVRIIQVYSGRQEVTWDRINECLFICLFPLLGILVTQDKCGEHPFDLDSLPTTYTLWILFTLAHFTSKYYKQKLSPGMILLVSSMLLMGIIFCACICIHFSSMGAMALFPFFNFLFLSPLFCLLYQFVEINKLHIYLRQALQSKNQNECSHINAFYRLLEKYHLGFSIYVLALLLIVIQACLYLAGQKADSIIRQFTDSCGFLLSYQQSCSCGGDHYLCSIAANGNKKLVKPLRMGIRKNEKILVNRQLLIANAFEHWLEENTPGLHKRIRKMYDGMGISVNKWSKRKQFANVLYIFMKPLEWFFLGWLYLFDCQPENRIAKQYLPKNELNLFIKNQNHENTN